jgi:hypothetical protein
MNARFPYVFGGTVREPDHPPARHPRNVREVSMDDFLNTVSEVISNRLALNIHETPLNGIILKVFRIPINARKKYPTIAIDTI